MRQGKENEDRKAATLNDPLTKTGSLAFASLPADLSLLDRSVRVIKTQMVADQVYDLICGGQQHPDFLRDTIQSLDPDCLPAFLRQLCKRIEVER
jgi:hypothetical protein